MTNADAPAPRQGGLVAGGPLWVSVEGINGVGKTEAVRAVAAALGPRCLRLDELTDQAGDTLPGLVISALAAHGDLFLRTGHPIAETLALLALKVREAERLGPEQLAGVGLILEDRGVDTVAVYQAVIVAAENPGTQAPLMAERILSAVRRWRPLPEATILLTGDRPVCEARFAARIGRHLTQRDLDVIGQADTLYRALAAAHPGRYTVLDTAGKNRHECAAALEETMRALLLGREAVDAP